MSCQPFTLRIRIGDNEIELSGSQLDVFKALDNLSEIVGKVSGAFNMPTSAIMDEAQLLKSDNEDYPAITVTPETPCPDAIIKLLSTDWGKKEPRKLSELLEAMKVNAIHYPLGTVKGRLTDLTKKGTLRRIKSNGGYGYILIKQG